MLNLVDNPNQVAKQIIDELPEDSSFDQLLRELAMHRMIGRGLDDLDHGRAITHEQMKARVASWFK